MTAVRIIDYDAHGYDYRQYWSGRDYERWAEQRALRRLVPRLGTPEWLIDLGGGFGRNAEHYRERAERYVIADYSETNLENASRLLAEDLAAGRAFLVRCDLNALPFVDGAFAAGMVVRVLHHLSGVDHALAEMGRTIADRWLVDVPIKHHALGVVRGVARGRCAAVRGPQPLRGGTDAEPYWNFQLAAIRQTLARGGWRTEVAASVNNLRRWDRRLPWALVRTIEAAAQTGGRGWWGPSQFVLAQRATAPVARVACEPPPADVPALATRAACPTCRNVLSWTPDEARCARCASTYRRRGGYWDFTVAEAAR